MGVDPEIRVWRRRLIREHDVKAVQREIAKQIIEFVFVAEQVQVVDFMTGWSN